MEILHFRADFLPVYIWAGCMILFCLLAIFRLRRFEKKYKLQLRANQPQICNRYKNMQLKMLIWVFIGVLSILPVLSFYTGESKFWIPAIAFILAALLMFYPPNNNEERR